LAAAGASASEVAVPGVAVGIDGLRPAGGGVLGVAVAKTAGGDEKAAGDGDA
jgi:hypothetical protein